MYKRRRNQRNFSDTKRQKARVLIGKPKQSNINIALQLKEVSEYLSSNGFPSTAQFVDVTKPEPQRMDLDIGIINLPMAVAPPAPAPAPPARRGGRRANAQPQDPAPQPAPNVPPLVTPEVQAQINAFYSTKVRRDADYLQEIYDLKVKLVSTDCMTKEFMNLFKEKEPAYIQLPPRALANRIVTVYDTLVSQDGWKVKQEADKECQALAQSEQESTDEYHQRFVNAYWSRNSKYTNAQSIPERDAARKFVENLNSKFHSMKSRLAQSQEHSQEFLQINPSFDYPYTLADAKLRVENEESRIESEKPKSTGKGKSYVAVGNSNPKRGGPKQGKKKLLTPQTQLPFNLQPNQKFKKVLNGHVVTGSNLKPDDKPSEYGYMYCPICNKKGYKNDHFKYFHQQFMKKVVGNKDKDKNDKSKDSNPPDNPTVNVLTKNDLQEFGKELAATIAEAIK